METLKIGQQITSVAVIGNPPDDRAELKLQDIDPDFVRIEKRPVGILSSDTQKLEFWTQEGRRTLYISVSYTDVEGVIDGNPIRVERPIEVFIPASQSTEDHQWESSTSRTLSFVCRQGGRIDIAIRDLMNVDWSKGPVRCGTKRGDKPKPLYHSSVAAMVAWGFLEMLRKRGIVDKDHMLVPAAQRAASRLPRPVMESPVPEPSERTTDHAARRVMDPCPEPKCGGYLIDPGDGCGICDVCNWSHCG